MTDFDDELDDEVFDLELFDVSDVVFTLSSKNTRRQITLIATSKTDFNLVRFYLALKDYLEKIENELNILEADDESH